MREVHELLKNFVERIHGAAGSNLESVILYGSAADGDFHQHSDLNVLCVMRSLTVEELSRVTEVVKWWTVVEKQPAPLFFTAEELRSSADVFAIELLDMKRVHRMLYGADPIAGLSIPMNLHRIQVEHELRTLLLKLRQHFVRAAQNEQELGAIVVKASSSIRTLLRHTLLALGEKSPEKFREMAGRLSELTGADRASFESILSMREGPQTGIVSSYGACLAALEKVISVLDKHMPKQQWQRAAKSSSP